MKIMMIIMICILVVICIGMILLERRMSLVLKFYELDEESYNQVKRENQELAVKVSFLKLERDSLERKLKEANRDMQNIPYCEEKR